MQGTCSVAALCLEVHGWNKAGEALHFSMSRFLSNRSLVHWAFAGVLGEACLKNMYVYIHTCV